MHAEAIRLTEGAELIGAASRSFSSVEKFCSLYPEAKAYGNYGELLDDEEVNTVAICSSSGEHFPQARMALEKGKSVIIEKPMTIAMKDAEVLIRLAEEKGLMLAVISQSLFSDASIAVREAIDKGYFGKMVSAQLMMRYNRGMDYYNSAPWRGTKAQDGGGILMNQGIHGIDLLCHYMGKPKKVTGFAKTRLRNIEVEDTAAVAVEFEDGAVAVIDATTCSTPSFTKKFIISGEKGTVIQENDAITLWNLPVPCPIEMGVTVGGSSASDPKAINVTYHQREYRNITDHYTKGTPLALDGNMGKRGLSVILGLYEASETGRSIEL